MSDQDDIKSLLVEISNNQKESIRNQQQHLAIAERQLARAESQIEESLQLQREAVGKQRQFLRVAVPLIIACILLIGYLVLRYF